MEWQVAEEAWLVEEVRIVEEARKAGEEWMKAEAEWKREEADEEHQVAINLAEYQQKEVERIQAEKETFHRWEDMDITFWKEKAEEQGEARVKAKKEAV